MSSPGLPDRTDARVGTVVVSMAGHDAGLVFVIIAALDDETVLVSDGKTRKLLTPKKKKMRHLSMLTRLSEEDIEMIRRGGICDSHLRRKISTLDLEKLTELNLSE